MSGGMGESNLRKHYHFIGIGGAGMSTLALLMLAKGQRVSGSDLKEGAVVNTLKEKGAWVVVGHDERNIVGADYVVYSSAVHPDNPELRAAKAQKIPVYQRAEFLAKLMENQTGITVAGAHGKTTTTSMISRLLIQAGLNPTTAVGGIIKGTQDNAKLGDGKYFVSEVDESDGTFLYFKPKISVITNIDFEHVDYYQTWENILEAYRKFIHNTVPDGTVVACGGDQRLRKLVQESERKFMTYGFSAAEDVMAQSVDFDKFNSRFDCFFKGKKMGAISLKVPGAHNVLNALACVGVGQLLNIDFSVIQQSLATYEGAARRFQLLGEIGNIKVIDDYGHHPTEITAVLQTAQAIKEKRLITVFQPHRYSRTKYLMNEFVKSLSLSDMLIITDIYAASEAPIEGVSSLVLTERLKQEGKSDCIYLKKDKILNLLLSFTRPGDLVLTLGAGDISQVGTDLVKGLMERDLFRG